MELAQRQRWLRQRLKDCQPTEAAVAAEEIRRLASLQAFLQASLHAQKAVAVETLQQEMHVQILISQSSAWLVRDQLADWQETKIHSPFYTKSGQFAERD